MKSVRDVNLRRFGGFTRGTEPIQWAFITIVVGLAIIVFAMSPLQAAIDEAAANNAALVAEEIRTAIDIVQATPADGFATTHVVNLRTNKCKIWFGSKSITVEMKKNVTLNTVQTDDIITVNNPEKMIDCGNHKTILITKLNNQIQIS